MRKPAKVIMARLRATAILSLYATVTLVVAAVCFIGIGAIDLRLIGSLRNGTGGAMSYVGLVLAHLPLLYGGWFLYRQWRILREGADGAAPCLMELDPMRHPRFYKLVHQLSQRMGVPAPTSCVLSPYHAMSIVARGGASGGPRLEVGAELVCDLQVNQLAALICREMAHLQGNRRSAKLSSGRIVFMFRQVYFRYLMRLAEEGRASVPVFILLSIRQLGKMITQPLRTDRTWRAIQANAAAASVVGPRVVGEALIRSEYTSILNGMRISAVASYMMDDTSPPANLYELRRLMEIHMQERERKEYQSMVYVESMGVWGICPSVPSQLVALSEIEAGNWENRKSATTLFFAWNHIECWLTARLYRSEGGRQYRRQRVEDWALNQVDRR